MTPTGIGMKSARTEALTLRRELNWSPERIAESLEVEVEQVREWLYGKKRPAKSRQGISPASPEQQAKVKGRACLKCRKPGPCDPAHLIDRSLASVGADDPRAVVPLCRECHRAFDEEQLDLLPYLEPHFREEVAFAVEQIGLTRALHRITGDRWVPVTTGGPE